MKIPDGTFDTILTMADMRFFPSIEKLNKKEKKSLEQRVENLIDFHSKAKLPFQAVKYIEKWISNKGFEKRDIFDEGVSKSKKYFYVDPWQQSSMIIVREGKKPITEGFRLVNSHADSPCLKIKQRPVRMEEEKMDSFNYLGLRLSTIPHGGIVVPYWVGQPVEVMGYTLNKNNSKKEIRFPGFVGVNSSHIDYSNWETVNEAFSPEKSLEIITGYSNIQDFLKDIGLKKIDDFSNTQLWAIPTTKMMPLGENKLNLLVGYGHDDRTGVFSAVDSIIKSNNSQYTSITWVSDNEEIYEPPPAGTNGPFLEILINKLIENQQRVQSRNITGVERYRMYTNSKTIVGDVTIAPYGHDKKDMDFKSSAKIGLGVAIMGNVQGNDPSFIRHLRDIASTKKSRKGVSHQLCGQFYNQDIMPVWGVFNSEDKRLKLKGVSEIWAGVPCASCHSTVEAICPGDEYAASELYKRFFESK
jgi:aspartyl aminopeptidase